MLVSFNMLFDAIPTLIENVLSIVDAHFGTCHPDM